MWRSFDATSGHPDTSTVARRSAYEYVIVKIRDRAFSCEKGLGRDDETSPTSQTSLCTPKDMHTHWSFSTIYAHTSEANEAI